MNNQYCLDALVYDAGHRCFIQIMVRNGQEPLILLLAVKLTDVIVLVVQCLIFDERQVGRWEGVRHDHAPENMLGMIANI